MMPHLDGAEHKRLMEIYTKCQGDLDLLHCVLLKEAEEYHVSLEILKRKSPTNAAIFAHHIIAGDYYDLFHSERKKDDNAMAVTAKNDNKHSS